MTTSFAPVLIRIAAAVAADGGAGVRRALEEALQEAAPFDEGEVALARTHGDVWRQPLGAAAGPILGLDLLNHVLAHGAPYRIDDWRDAEAFAQTLGLLRTRGLRSLLTVPFRFDAPGVPPLAGALAVGRTHGWAFVGASLPLLGPIASMAGLALDRTLVLTTLRERAYPLESVSSRSALAHLEVHRREAEDPKPDAASAAEPGEEAERQRAALLAAQRTAADRERECLEARAEAETLRSEAERAAAALREARGQGREQNARAEAAEARLLETERSRDDWAQQAASLRARCEEQEALIQSLRRGMAGARETAAAAADVAEAAQARVRELQDRVSELEGAMRAVESTGRER
jgi:hypothetical protein